MNVVNGLCVSLSPASVDLASLLQKPVGVRGGGGGEDGGIKAPSAQNLVFTNSHHHHHPPAQTRNGTGMSTGTTSYAHAALVSPPSDHAGAC